MYLKLSNSSDALILATAIPYSWKFSRNKNFEVFEDFDVSSKIKTSKFGFKIIFIGERALPQKFIHEKLER